VTLVAAGERLVRGSYGGETRVNALLSRASFAAFHTGPSATGDIEGVLICGAEGVRTLTVAFIPRPQPERRVGPSEAADDNKKR
jgi:hypothetical protein